MPKPPKALGVFDGLVSIMLTGDAIDIRNPKAWIENSYLGGLAMKGANNRANGDIISALADTTTMGRSKDIIKSQMQSTTAQIGADKTIDKKFWAIAYYKHRQLMSKKRVRKSDIAKEIYDLLVTHFPEDVPKNNFAQAGQIPKASTIETEWLGEKLS